MTGSQIRSKLKLAEIKVYSLRETLATAIQVNQRRSLRLPLGLLSKRETLATAIQVNQLSCLLDYLYVEQKNQSFNVHSVPSLVKLTYVDVLLGNHFSKLMLGRLAIETTEVYSLRETLATTTGILFIGTLVLLQRSTLLNINLVTTSRN